LRLRAIGWKLDLIVTSRLADERAMDQSAEPRRIRRIGEAISSHRSGAECHSGLRALEGQG
jgi:hypothetical protein